MLDSVACINFCMKDLPEAWEALAAFKAKYEATGDDLAASFCDRRDYDLEAELKTGDALSGICHI